MHKNLSFIIRWSNTLRESVVIEKGLSFCPDTNAKEFDLFLDLHKSGQLTLSRFFNIQKLKNTKNEDNEDTIRDKGQMGKTDANNRIGKYNEVRSKSTFYPIEAQGHYIQTFHDMVASEFNKITKTQN